MLPFIVKLLTSDTLKKNSELTSVQCVLFELLVYESF